MTVRPTTRVFASIPPYRRAAHGALALACVLTACLMLSAAPAAAKVVHQQEGSFNGSDRPTLESFSGLLPSIAADQTNGNVWVTESKFFGFAGKANAVDKFNGDGEYAGVQLTGENTPQGGFNFGFGTSPGVAVDNTSAGSNRGDLYVSDTGHGVVDRFDEDGNFVCQITGTTPGTPEAEEHECAGAAGSLTADESIEPGGLVVDSVGDLYVADRAHNKIDVFNSSGEYMEQIADSHLENLGSIALDSAGNLYVVNVNQNVVEFDSSGSFVAVVAEGDSPAGLAVDTANDHVYVGILREIAATGKRERVIAEYEPSDTSALDYFAPSPTGSFGVSYLGLTVNSTGEVYAAEPVGPGLQAGVPGEVLIYSADLIVPDAITLPPTNVEETTATLHGHLDPDAAHGGGEVTSCHFEYGLTKAYGESAPCAPAPPYSNPQDVSADLTGLLPSSTYHFRVEAANANGIPGIGEDETLTTSGLPSIDHQAADARTSSVDFKAKIDPHGYDTACQVQYVPDASFQESQWNAAATLPCQPADLGSGFGDFTVLFKVTGLARGTKYHYRFLASNQAGLVDGPEVTFETYGIQRYTLDDLKSSEGPTDIRTDHWQDWAPGEPETQAGAHPFEVTSTIALSETTIFNFNKFTNPPEETEASGYTGTNTKDIHTGLPAGLIGNPTAVPKCNKSVLHSDECPGDTQVGTIEVSVDFGVTGTRTTHREQEEPSYIEPLYNMTPSSQAPAEFGARINGNTTVSIPFHLRTGGDYSVSADAVNISNVNVPSRIRVHVWGVPASPDHDVFRRCIVQGKTIEPCSSTQPLKPLLRNPTSCTGPQTLTATADSWQEPGFFVAATTEIEGFTGCNALQFEPTLEAVPTTNVADSPSGLHVDLHVPQDLDSEGFENPNGFATADLKDAKVVLPQGLVVNPASANGLSACTSAQIDLHGANAPSCPDAAKIGRVEVDTPLVDHPLPGSVYVATPHDNPFGSLLAIYVVVDDPATGVIVKLPGRIEADPKTGQLTTTFDENPQLPFEDFKLDFFGGAKGALRTPSACGEYASASTLTPWSAPESGPPVAGKSPFRITQAPAAVEGSCPAAAAQQPSAPKFDAGTETPTAGRYSPFVLHLHREDGSQELTQLNTTLPSGLVGKLAGVAECSDAAIAAAKAKSGIQEQASPSCPSASQVGTVNVAAGAGPAPYWVTGHAYLAGPYKGAPLSLAIVTPAVAGPYDLGTVVVRAALYVNPETTQITVKSDSIPTILQGIPLDVRTIAVRMDRPQFTLNPTSCEKMSVGGEATSLLGVTSPLSTPFQVGGCRSLAFKPKLSLALKGSTKHTGHPALTATLTMPPGNANVGSAQVTLPHAEFLDQGHIRGTCLRPQLASHSCPADSVYGFAKAWSPLLDQPLAGPVYLTTGFGYQLPALVADLNGQIEVQLHGKVDSGREDGLRNTFEVVPDAPVSKFVLAMQGGKKGLIVNSENLCLPKTKRKALAAFVGQNGLVARSEPKVKVRCGRKGHHKHGHGKHGR
jgi:hypothetical protein